MHLRFTILICWLEVKKENHSPALDPLLRCYTRLHDFLNEVG